jgi:hypothetical protein
MYKLIKAGSYGCHSLPGKTIRKNEMISDEDYGKIPDDDKSLFGSESDDVVSGFMPAEHITPTKAKESGKEKSCNYGNPIDVLNRLVPDPYGPGPRNQ